MSFADVFDIPNDHSMVLAKPGQTNYFHEKIPAFDIRYIEDCFKIKDYPDPTKYLWVVPSLFFVLEELKSNNIKLNIPNNYNMLIAQAFLNFWADSIL